MNCTHFKLFPLEHFIHYVHVLYVIILERIMHGVWSLLYLIGILCNVFILFMRYQVYLMRNYFKYAGMSKLTKYSTTNVWYRKVKCKKTIIFCYYEYMDMFKCIICNAR